MNRKAFQAVALGAMLALAACGGQGGPTNPQVAKVVLGSESVLLTGIGSTQQLSAKALDAQGNTVSATITWESSKPANVGVDAKGLVTGVAVGSSQLTASAGGVKSQPIIAAVATLTSDTSNISQDNIVSGPTFINLTEGQAPTVGNQYTAVVRNLNPTVGRKWFSQGKNEQRLQGKIISVQDQPDGNKLVTLEVVPYEQIFSQLSIDEEIDFAQSPDTVPPGFEPQGVSSQAFVGINPFVECEGVGSDPPITLGIPTMNIGFTTNQASTGIRVNLGSLGSNFIEVRFRGTLNANLAFNGRITRNFSGNVDCRSRNPIIRSITGIPLPLMTSLVSERGLGVKFSGTFSGPGTDFQASGNLTVAIDIGANLNFSTGAITRFNTITSTANGLLRLTQANAITQFAVSAEAYVFDDWILNVSDGIAFDLWHDRNGVRAVTNMISVPEQITGGQRTSYRLERFGQNGPGPEFVAFLNFFNASKLFPPIRNYTDVIPEALFTLQSFSCDAHTTIRAECIVNFTERDFPVVGDNILKLEVWAQRGNGTPFLAGDTTQVSPALINLTVTTDSDTPLQFGDLCFLAVYTKTLPFAGIVAGKANYCMTNG